jgi:hypothetical protein
MLQRWHEACSANNAVGLIHPRDLTLTNRQSTTSKEIFLRLNGNISLPVGSYSTTCEANRRSGEAAMDYFQRIKLVYHLATLGRAIRVQLQPMLQEQFSISTLRALANLKRKEPSASAACVDEKQPMKRGDNP